MISRSAYSEIQYVVDESYCPQADRNIRYDEPKIGIQWDIGNPVLSPKDMNAPSLDEGDCNFTY